MQNAIYIKKNYWVTLPTRQPRLPRERYIEYYRDLYSLYGEALSAKTFHGDSQYSYTELGDRVLEMCHAANELADVDLVLVVTWAYEFDPDYASCTAYFADKYQMKAKFFDIGDQGLMNVFTAMDLAKRYFARCEAKKALLLVLEQTTIPRGETSNVKTPENNFANAIVLQKQRDLDSYEILQAGALSIPSLQSSLSSVLCQRDVVIYFKEHGCVSDFLRQVNLPNQTIHLANQYSQFPVLYQLHQLLKQKKPNKAVLILEEDVESKEIGYLHMRRT